MQVWCGLHFVWRFHWCLLQWLDKDNPCSWAQRSCQKSFSTLFSMLSMLSYPFFKEFLDFVCMARFQAETSLTTLRWRLSCCFYLSGRLWQILFTDLSIHYGCMAGKSKAQNSRESGGTQHVLLGELSWGRSRTRDQSWFVSLLAFIELATQLAIDSWNHAGAEEESYFASKLQELYGDGCAGAQGLWILIV